MTRTHKLVNLAGIVLPLVGLIVAVVVLWERMVGPTELAILAVGYVLTGAGITVGYHRLFTHRSFETYSGVRYTFAVLGGMAVEGDVVAWVSDHRKHHQFSDVEGDPHSPHVGYGEGLVAAVRGLWHAHSGWLLSAAGRADQSRYAKDLLRDRGLRVIAKLFLPLVLFSLVLPAMAGWLLIGGWYGFFAGLFWGGAVRIFLLQHVTFSINSICHVWGRRRFASPRRVAERLVAFLALVRRVVAQQPSRVPQLGVPRSPRRRDRSGRLADLAARARRPRLERRPHPAREAGPQARDSLGREARAVRCRRGESNPHSPEGTGF